MGTTSLCPRLGRRGSSWIFLCPFGTRSPGTSLYLEMGGRLLQTTSGVKFLGCFVGGGPRGQVRCLLFISCQFFFPFQFDLSLTFTCYVFAIKKGRKLKSRYKERIQAATEYTKTIDDFDDLIDPRTLARHFLGLEPSPFVLCAIEIEEKSEFGLVGFSSPFCCFLLCRDDDQIQSRVVCQDEGQEE